MLTAAVSLRCFARTWLVGAAMTTRGMQHLGLLYALDPGLQALHKEGEALQAARERYLVHVNTHPFMAPLFIGLLLALETLIAEKKMGAQNMASLTTTTATTLSALGDSFFSGTVLVFWALSFSLCVMLGMAWVAALGTAVLFLLLLAFRAWTFFLGLRQGLLALKWVRQINLINWGDRLKIVNALLLSLILWDMAPHAAPAFWWGNLFWGVMCLVGGALLINRARTPRLLLVGLVFLGYFLVMLKPPIP